LYHLKLLQRNLPFRSFKVHGTRAVTKEGVTPLYVGVDYGRSDVKVAVLSAQGETLSTFATRWYHYKTSTCEPGDGGGGSSDGENLVKEFVDPMKFESAETHVKVGKQGMWVSRAEERGV
jgi:hypothetical protein